MVAFDNRFGFENLEVYQLARKYAVAIHKTVEGFPRKEQFRLTDQLCRAGSSVALNVAEGRGRGTDKDFARFLRMSRGSLLESVAALQMSVDLDLLSLDTYDTLANQAGQVNAKLNALIAVLERG